MIGCSRFNVPICYPILLPGIFTQSEYKIETELSQVLSPAKQEKQKYAKFGFVIPQWEHPHQSHFIMHKYLPIREQKLKEGLYQTPSNVPNVTHVLTQHLTTIFNFFKSKRERECVDIYIHTQIYIYSKYIIYKRVLVGERGT